VSEASTSSPSLLSTLPCSGRGLTLILM